MATIRSECPYCHSARFVRLLSIADRWLKYWCGRCKKEFEVRA